MGEQETQDMKCVRVTIIGLVMLFSTSFVLAGDFNSSTLFSNGNPLQSKFDSLTKDLGSALSYKAVTPAEPLGLLGFDIGLEVTGTSLQGLDEWGDAIGEDSIDILPLPKLHAHKGLPLNLDVGLVYSKVPTTDISYIGGELRYSFVSGNLAIPAIAVRGSYTTVLGIDELDFSTKSVELTVSKGFLLFTPYIGAGNVWVNSEARSTPVAGGTEISVSSDTSMVKFFGGLNINLGLLNIVGEADKTGDAMSYTVKLGLRF